MSVVIGAILRKGGGCFSCGLHIAATSHIQIIVLFPLSITAGICIDHRESTVDLLGSLMLRAGTL